MPPLSSIGRGEPTPGAFQDWFQQQGAPPQLPGAPSGGAMNFRAPPRSAEDERLMQDPVFQQQYRAWVMAQGPGAGDWATPTIFQQQRQGTPTGTGPASAPPLQPGAPGGMPPGGAAQEDPLDYFNSLIGNLPPNSESLLSLEPQLAERGIKVMRNAAGIAGKIQLPSGEIVDVGGAFSSGDPSAMRWQTLRNDERFNPGQGGSSAAGGSGFGTLSGGTGSLAGLAAGALEKSPGFQFRLGEGMKALERSAAAKGTLLTGGTLKGLTRYAQDYASNEYGNQYARLFGEQGQRYNQLYGLSQLGLNAAGQQGGLGSSYAGQLGNLYSNQAGGGSDLITQGANAGAAGTVGQANAAAQGLSGVSNAAMQAYMLWLMGGGGGGGGGTPTLPGTNVGIPQIPR